MRLLKRNKFSLILAVVVCSIFTVHGSVFSASLYNVTLEATGTYSNSDTNTSDLPDDSGTNQHGGHGEVSFKIFWPGVDLFAQQEIYYYGQNELDGNYTENGSCQWGHYGNNGTYTCNGAFAGSGTLEYLDVHPDPLMVTLTDVNFFPFELVLPHGSCSGACDVENCAFSEDCEDPVFMNTTDPSEGGNDACQKTVVLNPSAVQAAGKYIVNVGNTCNMYTKNGTPGNYATHNSSFTWSGTLTFEKISGSSTTTTTGSSTTTTTGSSSTTTQFSDCSLSIVVSPPEGGTTSPPPPSYFSQGCLPVTITAIANAGFIFSHWEDGGGTVLSYFNPYTIAFSDSAMPEIVAIFINIKDICPSKQIYGEHSEEVELLRYLRDNVLSQTLEGQEIIRLYYEWSPVIVRTMEGDEEFRAQVKEMIDGILELIGE